MFFFSLPHSNAFSRPEIRNQCGITFEERASVNRFSVWQDGVKEQDADIDTEEELEDTKFQDSSSA
jgi:hypothetical protein